MYAKTVHIIDFVKHVTTSHVTLAITDTILIIQSRHQITIARDVCLKYKVVCIVMHQITVWYVTWDIIWMERISVNHVL